MFYKVFIIYVYTLFQKGAKREFARIYKIQNKDIEWKGWKKGEERRHERELEMS